MSQVKPREYNFDFDIHLQLPLPEYLCLAGAHAPIRTNQYEITVEVDLIPLLMSSRPLLLSTDVTSDFGIDYELQDRQQRT